MLVFPSFMNATPAVVAKARSLAEHGYLVMIADFYGETPASFEDAGGYIERLTADNSVFRSRLAAALSALRARPEAGGLPVAAIGFCLGGKAALELARSGADLIAAVSFHGLLDTPEPAAPDAIRARLLVCHGDADPMVAREQVIRFWEEMDAAGPIGISTPTPASSTASPIPSRQRSMRSATMPAPIGRAGRRCWACSTRSSNWPEQVRYRRERSQPCPDSTGVRPFLPSPR